MISCVDYNEYSHLPAYVREYQQCVGFHARQRISQSSILPRLVGKHLKAGGTQLEGDSFEFITAYDTLVTMGEHLKESMSSFELMSELLQIVKVNGGADDASLYCGSRRDRVSPVTEILLSLSTVKDVMVSINSEWWDWRGAGAPQPRYKGKIIRWESKVAGSEQLRIKLSIHGFVRQLYCSVVFGMCTKLATNCEPIV